MVGKTSRQSGFTLLEMMMVLGIVAILLGVGVPMMVGVFSDSQETQVKADFRTLDTGLVRYKTRSKIFPSTEQGLEALVNQPKAAPVPTNWKRVLKPEGILDPWLRPYVYEYPGKNNTDSYDLYSMGQDGKPNTEDDIGNWQL